MAHVVDQDAPNHHAGFPAFAGLSGLFAAATMTVGRRPVWQLAVELSDVGAGDRLVDVGCGPGAAARHASRCGAMVTGIDPAPVMLTVARRLTRRNRNITLATGRAEALPLADRSATVVWSIATVHHWADVEAGLAEVYRVLDTDGRLLAIERNSRPGATGHASHGWTEARAMSFAERCRGTGFVDVQVAPHRAGRRSLLAVTARKPAGGVCVSENGRLRQFSLTQTRVIC